MELWLADCYRRDVHGGDECAASCGTERRAVRSVGAQLPLFAHVHALPCDEHREWRVGNRELAAGYAAGVCRWEWKPANVCSRSFRGAEQWQLQCGDCGGTLL